MTFTFEDTLVGSFAANITIRHAGECGQPGAESLRAAARLPVLSRAKLALSISRSRATSPPAATPGASWSFSEAREGSRNHHGKLTLTGQAGVGGTHEGSVNFAP